ncbi:MAG TPA: hypothetical protein VNK48_18165 [Xanthobacteraceae bacterium]|nr:hypothetical protein [Xanthobacteraceae bacterium]
MSRAMSDVACCAEIRVMGLSGLEDYYAHLLRLDPPTCRPADEAVSAHCLNLLSARAILIGAYVDGVMRAAAEIVPDRAARQAEAAITVETGYEDRGLVRALTERVIAEARRYHLSMLRVVEQRLTGSVPLAARPLHVSG